MAFLEVSNESAVPLISTSVIILVFPQLIAFFSNKKYPIDQGWLQRNNTVHITEILEKGIQINWKLRVQCISVPGPR